MSPPELVHNQVLTSGEFCVKIATEAGFITKNCNQQLRRSDHSCLELQVFYYFVVTTVCKVHPLALKVCHNHLCCAV